ncbi:YhbY family RNA-binding protein [Planctomycetales bacterium ZRK34]|nr:YhbY family RNA-binding protein [Planctomycetales bacterium ZRK34]
MTLTSKQRKTLRGLGQKRPDDARLGKSGLTDGFIENLNELLDRRELVKLRFTDVEGAMRQTLADEVCQRVGAECAGVIGRTMLLYRANPELEDGQRVRIDA